MINSERTGKGVFTVPCEDTEESYKEDGNLVSGKLNGYVEVNYCNGSTYKGEMINSERTGKGVFTMPCEGTEESYKEDGNCVSGKLNGYATVHYCNGDTYKGEWKEGKYHGTGTYHHLGSYYSFIGSLTGQFTNNVLPDKGVIIYDDGNRYTGSLDSRGKRNGSGVMVYSNGQVKDGEWQSDTFVEPYQEPPSPSPAPYVPPTPAYEPPLRTYDCTCAHIRGFWPLAVGPFDKTYRVRASDMHEAKEDAIEENKRQ